MIAQFSTVATSINSCRLRHSMYRLWRVLSTAEIKSRILLSGAATTRYSDFFHVDLDLGEEVLADSLVDIGFPREVAIDVRWRHMQLARNIRDRCLLEAEIARRAAPLLR